MAELEIQGVDDSPIPKLVSKQDVDKKAQEIKDRITLPKKPGDRVQFREMKDWLNLLTPEQEEQVMIYVYRLDPPIVRQKVNPDALNNIDVIGSGFKQLEEQYLVDTQGGGKYQLTIKNTSYKSRAKGDDTGYFECHVTIPYILHKPKFAHIDGCGLDLREVNWDDPKCQSFKAWAVAQGLVDKAGNMIDKKEVHTQAQVSSDMVPVMKMMMEFVTKMSEKDQQALKKQIGGEDALTKSMGELMLEKMKQEDPNKQVSTLTTLITAIMSKNGGSDGGMAVMMPFFVQMMQSQQQSADRQFQMMMALLNKEKEGGDSKPESEVDKLKAIIEIAKEIKGGSAPQRSTAEVIVDGISNNLGPVLQIVGNIIALKTATVTGKAAPTVTNPIDLANQQNKQNVEGAEQKPPEGQAMISQSEAVNVLRGFAPLVYSNLNKEGWEFASWVEEGFPNGGAHVASVIKYGVDGIIDACKQVGQVMIPGVGQVDFWQQLNTTYGEAHMRKWLDEFCRYKEIIKEVEGQPDKE